MEILCSLDNIQFPITKYEIKNKEIKLEILFDTNKYKGVFAIRDKMYTITF